MDYQDLAEFEDYLDEEDLAEYEDRPNRPGQYPIWVFVIARKVLWWVKWVGIVLGTLCLLVFLVVNAMGLRRKSYRKKKKARGKAAAAGGRGHAGNSVKTPLMIGGVRKRR